jgi:hypothetical protein
MGGRYIVYTVNPKIVLPPVIVLPFLEFIKEKNEDSFSFWVRSGGLIILPGVLFQDLRYQSLWRRDERNSKFYSIRPLSRIEI